LNSTIDVDLEHWMQSINLTASMTDSGDLVDTAYFFLQFHDINDHHPIFRQAEYEFYLDGEVYLVSLHPTDRLPPESTPGGVDLFQVHADDDDLTSPNHNIKYFINEDEYLARLYFQVQFPLPEMLISSPSFARLIQMMA
jgi:hypothetical protein